MGMGGVDINIKWIILWITDSDCRNDVDCGCGKVVEVRCGAGLREWNHNGKNFIGRALGRNGHNGIMIGKLWLVWKMDSWAILGDLKGSFRYLYPHNTCYFA